MDRFGGITYFQKRESLKKLIKKVRWGSLDFPVEFESIGKKILVIWPDYNAGREDLHYLSGALYIL